MDGFLSVSSLSASPLSGDLPFFVGRRGILAETLTGSAENGTIWGYWIRIAFSLGLGYRAWGGHENKWQRRSVYVENSCF